MFDYENDYDEYYEPSELDEALEQFKDGIRKMLNKDISDELNNNAVHISNLEDRIKRLQDNLAEARAQIREEKKESVSEERARIIGPIRKGDTVYVVRNVANEITCPHCVDGFIEGADGSELKCPSCYGRGKKNVHELKVLEKKVSKVKIILEDRGSQPYIAKRQYHVDGEDEHSLVFMSERKAQEALESGKTNKWQYPVSYEV